MPNIWNQIWSARHSEKTQSQSDTLFSKIANSFPAPIFVIDGKEDKFIWISPGASWLTGLSTDEIALIRATDYLEAKFSPKDTLLQLIKERIKQAEVSLNYDDHIKTLHMLGYWMELEPHLYVLILQDVTELREAQNELAQYSEELRQQVDALTELQESLKITNQKLAESQERLRLLAAVASYTDNAVIITDAQGRALWVNRGFERISGYTLDDVRGKIPGHLLQGPDTDKATVARIREKLRQKTPFVEEILNYSKDGRPYWIRLYITPLTNELNEITNFVAIELDITEEKARLQAMERQLEDIRQAQQYAARIFKRFLPDIQGLRSYFKEVEMWNAPMQGLGGDFYFFAPQEGQVIIALGDSTGHGAAAALISAYALTSLWRSTRNQVNDLISMYHDLMEGILLSSEQEAYTEGFELALLRYDMTTSRLEYLGAKRPLWIFRAGQLIELRGARSDVNAGSIHMQPEVQTLHLQRGDRLYLFSDGMTSQLNQEGKKFGAQRLRNFLQVNQYLSIPEQIAFLKQAIEQWRGGTPQTDDILIVGIEA
ncbi:MAG: PAS domain S-box protein [Bacteroidia bacterium]|nr:PAS domain S-box protein [Bacteroidia bacterium]MCX7652720.1 PAS domain S-box protein [Bacteroidia bacterium]MDW8416396.1 PAS domain S-box protein [Bacteroidia bacterium]